MYFASGLKVRWFNGFLLYPVQSVNLMFDQAMTCWWKIPVDTERLRLIISIQAWLMTTIAG